MQPNGLHHEYMRALEQERARAVRQPRLRYAHAPPANPRPTRRRAAEALARLAWRLDREAALRAWP